ncbi:MAG: hypothetical protein ACRD1F_05805 [Terriglobales bacterium]
MKTTALAFIAALALALAPVAFGQAPSPKPAYQVEFLLTSQTASAAPVTHDYTLLLRASGAPADINTGDKIPISTGDHQQFSYHSIGVRLHCTLLPVSTSTGKVPLRVTAEVNSIASRPAIADPGPPTISTVSTSFETQVSVDRKQTIASFDDATTHTHYQLAVLVKPVQ